MKNRFMLGYFFGAGMMILATVLDSLGFPHGWPAFVGGVTLGCTGFYIAHRINRKEETGC